MVDLELIGEKSKTSLQEMLLVDAVVRDKALGQIAKNLIVRKKELLDANAKDCKMAIANKIDDAALKRLELTSTKIESLVKDVQKIRDMPDLLGSWFDVKEMPNGLRVMKKRVPLGVIAVIYESRPNVTVDISVLCIKTGNALILRGGSEAYESNLALSKVIVDSIASVGLPKDSIQFIQSKDRKIVDGILKMNKYIDLLIPRGSANLVYKVAREATMPAVTGGVGVCHMYVDDEIDVSVATKVLTNSKLSRPYACNALDTMLIHSSSAKEILLSISSNPEWKNVELLCDGNAFSILNENPNAFKVADADWGNEFLSLKIAIKIVDSIDEAIRHIWQFSSGHTDGILTTNASKSNQFLDEVDSAVVVVNASTAFNDGGQLGLGSEVAISTEKIHARGPMGMESLLSYKWIVLGNGQIRPSE